MNTNPTSVTTLLNAWNAGSKSAGDELMTRVYQELRRLAAHYLQDEHPGQTLQPTALVHELYLKLFSKEVVEWHNRGHFLAVAARQLRHIIVDHARNQHAQKRGGLQAKLSMEDTPEVGVVMDNRVLVLNDALERLGQLDPRSAQVVELRYFGGLTESEIAKVLEISPATVKRDWEFARAWLLKRMK